MISLSFAAAGIFIAAVNVWMSLTKAKIDLMEKRSNVKADVIEYINHSTSQEPTREAFLKFWTSTRQSKFLFNADIAAFVKEVEDTVARKNHCDGLVKHANDNRREAAIEEAQKAYDRLETLRSQVDAKFDPHIKINFSKRGYMVPRWWPWGG